MLPGHRTNSDVRPSMLRWRLQLTWLLRIVFIHLAIPNSSWMSSFRLKESRFQCGEEEKRQGAGSPLVSLS